MGTSVPPTLGTLHCGLQVRLTPWTPLGHPASQRLVPWLGISLVDWGAGWAWGVSIPVFFHTWQQVHFEGEWLILSRDYFLGRGG